MIVRLSDLSRRLILISAILIASLLVYFAVRTAIARYASDEFNLKQAERAVRLEPSNPQYWYLLGRSQQFSMETPDSSLARRSFQEAIALDPQATDAWLDLATLEELDGDNAKASEAYLRARQSYPVSAEVCWRYGNFLLRQDDKTGAYSEIRKAIDRDPHFAIIAFTRVFRSNPDIEDILENLLPAKQSVYLDVIEEAVNENQLAAAKIIWARLIALHPRLGIREIDQLVSHLRLAGELSEARRVWDQGIATMNLPPLYQQKDSVIWDPSFESNIYAYTFSWQFQPMVGGVAINVSNSESHSGSQSLHLVFDGKHNPNLDDAACAIGAVHPNMRYELTGWIKTKEITTNYGIAFRIQSIEDPSLPSVKSEEWHGTIPWTLVREQWTSGPQTQTVRVCVIREPSDNPDIRISGQAWVDDVNLVPSPDRTKIVLVH